MVRVCPECGSKEVEQDFLYKDASYRNSGTKDRWKCNECGYTGIMPQK